jgi:hypothetical protein
MLCFSRTQRKKSKERKPISACQETVIQASICVFWGIPCWEWLPRFANLEQTCQTLIEAFDGPKKIRDPMVPSVTSRESKSVASALLSWVARRTLFGEQGAHRGGIPLLDLALLQFLKSPGGLAHMIDGVAKFTQYAGIHPTRPDGFLQFQQAVDRHLQPERRAPERFAGSEKFDGHSQHLALFRGTQGYHLRRDCFSRREIL